MTEHDRAIGRLEAAVGNLEKVVARLDGRVDVLREWKWRVVGGAAVVSALIGIAFQAWK